MSCYRPNFMIPVGLNENGKTRYKFLSTQEVKRTTKFLSNGQEILVPNYDYLKANFPDYVQVPCGKCLGCRLDYSRSWADRMMLELDSYSGRAVFATLTYDNDHAHWSSFAEDDRPLFATLDKRDCQLFMKRLRKHFSDVRISFFLSGEYGPTTLRPHYHCILYGLSLEDLCDKSLDCFGRNELGQQYYKSDLLTSIWQNGHTLISEVSYNTCAYVARYVTKKLCSDDTYAERNVCKEFSLMSRNPAIGLNYLNAHPGCLDYQYINISTSDGGRKIALPRYFIRRLDLPGTDLLPNPLYNPEKYDMIRETRKQLASDSFLLKLSKTSLSALDYLEDCERKKLKDTAVLTRDKL